MNEIYFKVSTNKIRGSQGAEGWERGIIGEMGADRWQTLTVLASFMDESGRCYPSQELIADILGISRETANRRIRSLVNYRHNGKPIVTKERTRSSEGIWQHNVYVIDVEQTGLRFGSSM